MRHFGRRAYARGTSRIWVPVIGGFIAMVLIVGHHHYSKHRLAAPPPAPAPPTVAAPGTQTVQLAQLATGDCLNGMHEDVAVTQMTTVPCTKPHDGEVVYRFDLPGGWPGVHVAEVQAGKRCDKEMQSRLVNPDSVDTSFLYPNTEEDWDAGAAVTCIARDRNHQQLAGPLGRMVL